MSDLMRATAAYWERVQRWAIYGLVAGESHETVAGGASSGPPRGQDLSQAGTGLAAATAAEPSRVHGQAEARPSQQTLRRSAREETYEPASSVSGPGAEQEAH